MRLTSIFKARGINKPYRFLIEAGFTQRVATNLAHNKAAAINLKHIERLCAVLICEPNDLFVWVPDKKFQLAADHPLNKILHQEKVENVEQLIAAMSLQQLKELTQSIADKKQG